MRHGLITLIPGVELKKAAMYSTIPNGILVSKCLTDQDASYQILLPIRTAHSTSLVPSNSSQHILTGEGDHVICHHHEP